METPILFNVGEIVTHAIDNRVFLIILEANQANIGYYTCRYRNVISGLFVIGDFYGFELLPTQKI